LFLGLLNALRWGWLLLIPACMALKPLQKTFAILLILSTAAALLFISGDYSRSVAVMLPAAILGFLFAAKIKNTGRWMILLALVSFITPAYFSFRAFHVRIKPLSEQIADAKGFNRILDARIREMRARSTAPK